MKNLFSAAFLSCFFFSSCTKENAKPGITGGDTESPTIKVISPLDIPDLRPGDYLDIKATISDNRLINTVAWEAMNAASACGNSPYKAEFSPVEAVYEMNIKFLVPSNFSGNRFIRLYAVDNSGNYTIKDVSFVAGN